MFSYKLLYKMNSEKEVFFSQCQMKFEKYQYDHVFQVNLN